MDKLTEILEEHTRFESYACTCGWQIKDDFDYASLTAHLAEMLKPLLAEVWYAGFDAQAYNQHNNIALTNPYTKESK